MRKSYKPIESSIFFGQSLISSVRRFATGDLLTHTSGPHIIEQILVFRRQSCILCKIEILVIILHGRGCEVTGA